MPYIFGSKRILITNTVSFAGGYIPRLQVVTTRNELQCDVRASARTSANNHIASRVRVYAGADIMANSLRFIANSFVNLISGATVDASAFLAGASIEFGGVAFVFSWGGSTFGSVAAGEAEKVSDTLIHPFIPRGSEIWINYERKYAVGDQPIYVKSDAPSPLITGEMSQSGADGTVASRLAVAGTKSASGGWTTVSGVLTPSFVIVGLTTSPTEAIGVVGASLERGANDNWGDGANGAGGYIRRGLSASTGTKYASIQFAKSGERVDTYLTASAKKQAYYKYCNKILEGFGGNDFTDGKTTSEMLTNLSTLKAQFISAGVTNFAHIRMAPKTDSTDNWTTTANQTVRIVSGTNFLTYRTAIDAGVQSAGWYLIDLTAAYEQAGMPGIWKADGVTAALSTDDGTHPSPLRHGDAGPALQAAIPAFLAVI